MTDSETGDSDRLLGLRNWGWQLVGYLMAGTFKDRQEADRLADELRRIDAEKGWA